MGWPLTGAGGECIGLIEGRNKKDGESFDVSDQQIAQIFAHQVGSAVSQSKQQALLADRNDAFNKAYEKNFDKSEAISLTGGNKGQEAINGANDSGYSGVEFAATALGTGHAETAQDLQNWNYDVFEKSLDIDATITAPYFYLVNIIPHATRYARRSIAELEMLFVDVFEDRGLFTRFSIDIKVFLKFTQEIIAGYSTETPYHNYFHGFDVMHVCYLFVSTCDADGYLEDFNILSLLVGAIAHDVGHDGLNNAFHAASMSELAITYNSISILENFSAAFLFRIMKKEGCDIFKRIPDPELKKLRTRLIDLILDTDAKNHFILMTRFKHGLEMKQLSRGLLSSMILHIADVSNPTRPGGISMKWAFAVQEEFFRQGDKEKALGMSVSPFMDRGYENLPRMQGAFIDALVSPVFHLTAEFLPKIKDNCIRSMQLNRAFWNNLQNKQVMTTSDIKKVLATDNVPEKLLSPERGEKKKLSVSVGGEEKKEGENGKVDEVNSPQVSNYEDEAQ
ncbi:hypothetical protein TL16_g05386 [Triparma laevis f. inornata]|uniref:Phosphodiesterase n=1 Tax=Triparma laevis f. inornata TaxID=1714386 RepID=A0A9W7E9E9_9STRA|nr:hypothetical protein TL16_g05386 [Triparma laevis f. inornata]